MKNLSNKGAISGIRINFQNNLIKLEQLRFGFKALWQKITAIDSANGTDR